MMQMFQARSSSPWHWAVRLLGQPLLLICLLGLWVAPLQARDVDKVDLEGAANDAPEAGFPGEGDRPPLDAAPIAPSLYPLEDYRLTVGDIVYVGVANVPDYSGTFQVLPGGALNLPVLGHVAVWGMTLPEAEQAITEAYAAAEILVEPRITVTISQLSPLEVVIIGEVSRPGVYLLSPLQGRLPTVATAIYAAGGITQHTDLQSIEIRRVSPDNQQEETITVSLWDLLTQGARNQDLPLRDGDTIVVPQTESIGVAIARELATSSFSAGAVQVNIVGEIAQPGVMQVPADTSVMEALLLAGSFTQRSRRSRVTLLRLNPDGTVTERSLPVDFTAATNDDTNPLLQNRDVLLVGRNWGASVTDTVGGIMQPVTSGLSLLNLFLPFLFTP
ncbi:MAG: polysaccharide biosynthesis/export family protein [Synechococcales bacterium]|nr:polysaccharide biosynthesis/export family protein [Synechococcales bacterium]